MCYIPGGEALIRSVLEDFDWDFVTGSVHFIDGWGFDHKESISVWNSVNVAEVYNRYYEIVENLIESDLFTVLAHPDSIKCFGYVSEKDLAFTYQAIAVALKAKNMKVEFSNGLHINYGTSELGMNRKLLEAMVMNDVEIVTASDAHKPEDVGRLIEESHQLVVEAHKLKKHI